MRAPLVLLLVSFAHASNSVTLSVESGTLKGSLTDDGVAAFLGVPFAEPPIGELRWRAPQTPAESWSGERAATKYSPACMQGSNAFTALTSTSEDCLYLNVWLPEAALGGGEAGGGNATKYPVMLFFYGGSWTTGSAMFPLYSGKPIVSQTQNTIVVATNYRLNAFGFLGSDRLRDAATGSTGNLGLLDQRAAMRWIHANAAALRADTSRLLIFGESAGAGSVSNHLVLPSSWPLFTRAAMQSGPMSPWTAQPLALAEKRFDAFVAQAGCTAAGDTPALQACLRALNSSEVAAAARGLPTEDLLCDWSPVIDGVELTAHPQVLAEQGKVHAVPTLLGTNQDEGTEFVHLALNASEADFEAYAEQNAPGYGAAIAAQYPVSAYKKTTYASAAWWAATHFLGDSQMSCPARRTARWMTAAAAAAAAAQNKTGAAAQVYLYFLTHKLAMTDAVELKNKKPLGVFHGTDLGFVFDFTELLLTAKEKALAKTIVQYWSSFADTGTPQAAGAVAWPAYDAATDQNVQLDVVPALGFGLKKSVCDFWDSVPRNATAHF